MYKQYYYRFIFVISVILLLGMPYSLGDSTLSDRYVVEHQIKKLIRLQKLRKQKILQMKNEEISGRGPIYCDLRTKVEEMEKRITLEMHFVDDLLTANEELKSPKKHLEVTYLLPIVLFLLSFSGIFTFLLKDFKHQSVFIARSFTNLPNLFRFVLSEEKIETLECDAIEYAEDKKYPELYKYCYLAPCLICQSYRQISKQLMARVNQVIK